MKSSLVVKGKKIITLSDEGILRNGVIVIKDGKIVKIGEAINFPSNAEIVKGEIVTPGLIDAHTHLGVYPLEREGGDQAVEIADPVSPHLRVVDALDPSDQGFKDALSGGVTTVVVHPGSPMSFGKMVERITIMPGQSAVVKTNGRVLNECAGIKMALGEHPKRFLEELKLPPTTRMGIIAIIRSNLAKAQDYMEKEEKESDPKLDALTRLLRGECPARVHVHIIRDIMAILRVAEEYKFKVVLEHATEAHLISDRLAEKAIPVVLGPIIFSRRGSELKNLSANAAATLEEKNVLFAITTDHPTIPIQYLSIVTAVAESEGLKNGLKAITLNAAKIAGVSNKVGSIELGKDADIAIFSGDPMEVGSKTLYTIVDGKIEYRRD